MFTADRKTEKQTEARVLYDNDNLYVAATCFEPEPAKIVRDGKKICKNDIFEIFIDHNLDRRTAYHFPKGRYDKDGGLLRPMDFTDFDEEIFFKGDKHCVYYIGLADIQGWPLCIVKSGLKGAARDNAYRNWLRQVIAHCKQLGLGYDRFSFFPYDEISLERIPEFTHNCRIIREADPQAKIMLTLGAYAKNLEVAKVVAEYVDIWCPFVHFVRYFNEDKFRTDFDALYQFCRSTGKPVWSYENCIRRDPSAAYHSYRLKPWGAYRLGLDGYGFCAHNTWRVPVRPGRPWKLLSQNAMAILAQAHDAVYPGPEPVPSVRWDGLREGMNDIKYVRVLEELIRQAKQDRTSRELTARAERLVEDALNDVPRQRDDPDLVYAYRERIARMIMALKEAR